MKSRGRDLVESLEKVLIVDENRELINWVQKTYQKGQRMD